MRLMLTINYALFYNYFLAFSIVIIVSYILFFAIKVVVDIIQGCRLLMVNQLCHLLNETCM